MYDVLIIGCGPAGLTAGIFSVRRNLKALIINDPASLSQTEEATIIEDWPGDFGISGMDLVKKMKAHAKKIGVELKEEKVKGIKKSKAGFTVNTDQATYRAKTIIISTGATHRKAMVPGESEFSGKGVSYCASCDAPLFKGKRVLVIGGGDAALMAAELLDRIGADTALVHRRDKFRAAEFWQKKIFDRKIKVYWNTVLKEIRGDKLVKSALLLDTKEKRTREEPVDGIFIAIGTVPTTEIVKDTGLKTDDRGFIMVDREMRTNVKGIFAAGDCTDGPAKKIVTAAGDGGIAAESAYYLITGGPYGKK
jgi:thioredoxin reductase (NADPH)